MEAFGVIAFGAALLLFGLSVTYGVIGPRSTFVQRARAAYAYRAPSMTWTPFSPARFLVMIPPWGLATVLVAIASLLPAGLNGLEDALMVTAICSLLVGFVAFLWPRPFLPRWAKDADARIEAGLPPTMPEPVELAAGRRMTRRQWIAGHLVLLAAVVANLVFRVGPPSIAGPLLMGWAFWAAAQARAASGR